MSYHKRKDSHKPFDNKKKGRRTWNDSESANRDCIGRRFLKKFDFIGNMEGVICSYSDPLYVVRFSNNEDHYMTQDQVDELLNPLSYIQKTFVKLYKGTYVEGRIINYVHPHFKAKFIGPNGQEVNEDMDESEVIAALESASLIRKTIHKYFEGKGCFEGLVVQYNDPFFRVKYADNDEEDVTHLELVALLEAETFYFKKIIKQFKNIGDFEGTIVGYGDPFFHVVYEDGDEEDLTRSQVMKLVGSKKKRLIVASNPPEWQIPGACTTHLFSGLRPLIIEVESTGVTEERNFFQEFFSRDRTLVLKQKLTAASKAFRPLPQFEQFGCVYSLFSVKIIEDGRSFMGGMRKSVEYLYVAISGQGLPTISIQNELERVADFSSLKSIRKMSMRLELFQSGSVSGTPPFRMKTSQYEIIDEAISSATQEYMGDGCGFIPSHMLRELIGGNSEKYLAIQVRVFGPQIGIWKGMLCSKPGIDRIQLPPSMRKVPASVTNLDDDWVSLVVIRNSPSSRNMELERYLAGNLPSASFETKELSIMVKRLWLSAKVPKNVIQQHTAKKYPEHTWVVGLADPTNQLPPGTVFVTGWRYLQKCPTYTMQDRIYVTRSPCVKPEDGKLLPVVAEKPPQMTHQAWMWLLELPFGGLIFSTSGSDLPPLASTCAAGDLDGDLYFICWDDAIIQHIQFSSVDDAVKESYKHKYMPKRNEDDERDVVRKRDWFQQVQNYLISGLVVNENQLISRIYKEMEKVLKTSAQGMDDPDYIHYADAYLLAIDRGKHGIDVVLPQRLRAAVGL